MFEFDCLMIYQAAVNALVVSCQYFVVAISFYAIYRAAGFFHFAHGAVVAAGPYLLLLFSKWLGVPWALAACAAVSGCGAVGCVSYLLVYRPLRRRNSTALVLMLASLGTYVVMQNLISMAFGDYRQTIRLGGLKEGLGILGAKVTPIQIVTVAVGVSVALGLAWAVRVTMPGKAFRAVANDPQLASASGIESDRVVLWCFGLGSALGGTAGVLIALDLDMIPTMGMNPLVFGIVAVVVGGARRVLGIAFGALLLGAAQHFGVLAIGFRWQDAIAFAMLFGFLVMRPQELARRGSVKAAP